MKVTVTEKIIPKLKNSAVALGCFDGLHLGHQSVISAAFKDFPGNRCVFSVCPPQKSPLEIIPGNEREKVLAALSADYFIRPDFDSIKNLSPQEFVEDILRDKLNAARVSCGFNYKFGHNGEGTAKTLQSLCREKGIECVIIEPVCFPDSGETVSSSALRNAMETGDIKRLTAGLGRRWGYFLPVSHGKKLGRTLGAPTMNQFFPPSLLLPKFGVYASRAQIEPDGEWLPSVTNIGKKPTVDGRTALSETFIPGFSDDVYGKTVRVELAAFLRPEKKFSSLEELKNAILHDAKECIKYSL